MYSLLTLKLIQNVTLVLKNKKHYDFISPLLDRQSYIKDVKTLEEVEWDDIEINLDSFRPVHRKDVHKHLAKCHLEANGLKASLKQKWLEVDPMRKAPIIINRTPRYRGGSLDWSILKDYQDDCCFIGLEKEWKVFQKETGLDIKYHSCDNALEIASVIKGSDLFLGNQSFAYACAEALKHPRVLEVYEAMSNCMPQTDNGYTKITDRLLKEYLYK